MMNRREFVAAAGAGALSASCGGRGDASAPASSAPPPPSPHSPGTLTPTPVGNGLTGPYIDEKFHTGLSFGQRSHYWQPWRGYLETMPASRALDGLGIGFNVAVGSAPLMAKHIARNGFRRVRVEIGFGAVNSQDETQFNGKPHWMSVLRACRDSGLRPLMLLNAHQGGPCPMSVTNDISVVSDAAVGARQVALSSVSGLVARHSGLSNQTGYWAAEVLFESFNGSIATLSKPLPKALSAGQKVQVATLKYRPFSTPSFADHQETIAAWQRYVLTIARFVAEELGTQDDATDKGFDLEIWNELGFGTEFLNVNNYYETPVATIDHRAIYAELVQATAQIVEANPASFAGVTLCDGFSNTIPWPASSTQPARVNALSKHPYRNGTAFPQGERADKDQWLLDALGQTRAGQFVPSYTALLPEFYGTAITTEHALRDFAPLTTNIYRVPHGRHARAAAQGGAVNGYITEVNISLAENGVTDMNAVHALKSKTLLRYAAFWLNKGAAALYFYAAVGDEREYGIVQQNFADYAGANTVYPSDDSAYTAPALLALRRMTDKLRAGVSSALTATRPIGVLSITDQHDDKQFDGDGTASNPPLFNREVFAVLPFQVNASRFAVALYVMTRDVTRSLEPKRYTLELTGLKTSQLTIELYDPIADAMLPVELHRKDDAVLQLTVPAADYPYLLLLDEG